MNDWLKFLKNQGGQFKADFLNDFGALNREQHLVETGAVFSPLTDYSVLKFSGEDAKEFLQNQLSNDVAKISDTVVQYSSWCTHQGKVIASLLLMQQGADFYAVVASDLLDKLLPRLQMFILRSAVSVSVSEQVMLEVYGEQTMRRLPNFPDEPRQKLVENEVSFIRLSGEKPRGLIIAPPLKMQEIWQILDVDCVPIGRDARQLIVIKSGIVEISLHNSEQFTPHAINMVATNAVDFKKGCYPGQEVVARMQYLGKNKHGFYRILIDRNSVLPAGSKLTSSTSQSVKGAGQIIQSAMNADGEMLGLAVIENQAMVNKSVLDFEGNLVVELAD